MSKKLIGVIGSVCVIGTLFSVAYKMLHNVDSQEENVSIENTETVATEDTKVTDLDKIVSLPELDKVAKANFKRKTSGRPTDETIEKLYRANSIFIDVCTNTDVINYYRDTLATNDSEVISAEIWKVISEYIENGES